MKIGKIGFSNLYPIFYCLEKAYRQQGTGKKVRYEFIAGVPSYINALINKGSIDVSPSSSIEYLRNPGMYELIEGHSISSTGPIMSIVLFSKTRIENLGGATVLASFQSETSTALLKVILSEFYGLSVDVKVSDASLKEGLAGYPAYMLIGDNALLEASHGQVGGIHLYDLGSIWYEHTGLPFVFALWIARRDCNKENVARFVEDLDRAKAEAVSNIGDIAESSPYRDVFSKEFLVKYWNTISYSLTESDKEGLKLFERHIRKLHLI